MIGCIGRDVEVVMDNGGTVKSQNSWCPSQNSNPGYPK
jgi:hypothetical protein